MKDIIISEKTKEKKTVKRYYGHNCAGRSGLSIKSY